MGQGHSTPTENSSVINKKPIKIVLLGDVGAGKTSILRRLTHHTFLSDYEATTTLKVEPLTREIKLKSNRFKIVSIQLWDIPSHEDIDLRPTYLSSTDGAIVVADLTQESSIALADSYKKEIERANEFTDFPAILIGSKLDLATEERERAKDRLEIVGPKGKRPTTTKETARLLKEWKKLTIDEEVETVEAVFDPDLIADIPDVEDDGISTDSDDETLPNVATLKEAGKSGEFLSVASLSLKSDIRPLLKSFDVLVKNIIARKEKLESSPRTSEKVNEVNIPKQLTLEICGMSETDSYVKDVQILIKRFLQSVKDFNETLKSFKKLCVEKELVSHATVSFVDCVLNLSEACSFQLKTRPIPGTTDLDEILWPKMENTSTRSDEEELDESEEMSRIVLRFFHERLSPAIARLQNISLQEENLESLKHRMTTSLKKQMQQASENGESWTREADPISGLANGKKEMEMLKRINGKNLRAINSALCLMRKSHFRLMEQNKKLKAALI